MLLELGVLAGQVSEVGRLVLVPVASVHGLVEGHGRGEPPRERGAGSPPSPPTDRPAPGEHRGALGRTKVRQARGGASGCQTAQTIAQSGEGGGGAAAAVGVGRLEIYILKYKCFIYGRHRLRVRD